MLKSNPSCDVTANPQNRQQVSVGRLREITVAEAAALKNVSSATIRNWLHRGRIRSRKVGRRYFILVDESFHNISVAGQKGKRNHILEENQQLHKRNEVLHCQNISLQQRLDDMENLCKELVGKYEDAVTSLQNLEAQLACSGHSSHFSVVAVSDIAGAAHEVPLLVDSRMRQKLLPPPNYLHEEALRYPFP